MKQISNQQFELPVIGTVADTQSVERAQAPRHDAHITEYWARYFAGVGMLTPEMIAAWNGGAK